MAIRTPPAGTAGPDTRMDWRSDVAGASGLNIIAGIWLIISPWVLGFHSGDSYWNPIVCGVVVAVLALIRATGAYRESWLSWVNALVGAWLFVSGWWLASSSQAEWNDWIMGAVVFGLAVISAAATESRPRRTPPRGSELSEQH